MSVHLNIQIYALFAIHSLSLTYTKHFLLKLGVVIWPIDMRVSWFCSDPCCSVFNLSIFSCVSTVSTFRWCCLLRGVEKVPSVTFIDILLYLAIFYHAGQLLFPDGGKKYFWIWAVPVVVAFYLA